MWIFGVIQEGDPAMHFGTLAEAMAVAAGMEGTVTVEQYRIDTKTWKGTKGLVLAALSGRGWCQSTRVVATFIDGVKQP